MLNRMDFGLFDVDDDDDGSPPPLNTTSSNAFRCAFSYALDGAAAAASAADAAAAPLLAVDANSAPKMFRCKSTDGDGGDAIASSFAELPVIFKLFNDSGSYGSSSCGSTRFTAVCQVANEMGVINVQTWNVQNCGQILPIDPNCSPPNRKSLRQHHRFL